ncbi:DeoR/GlpR family DNA-binding transcription regulator, partial [Photobacterium sp. OFAV2-7]|uniref:DeoR/GlpR family DNA-binding transcription regulator n=1 Tax=Photobacterium sp. OFAV2-7 TaxID=2917748 RepID=UPI001EF6B617
QTVRRDIKKLSELKLLIRHHGGAGRCSSVLNLDYEVRQDSEIKEKEDIGAAIADYIPDNSTVFVTIGTTTEIIAKHLMKRKGLRVITNSLRVANVLYGKKDFDVMVPGGKLRSHNSGIVGSTALDFVRRFRVDYLITSLGSIDTDGTMLDYDFNEVNIVQTMMRTARNIYVAADSTKFSTTAAVEIGNIKDISALFTDKQPPADLNIMLKQNNVKVVVVD